MARIVTELRELGDQGIVRFPAGSRDFSLYQNVHTSCGAHLPPVQWVLGGYYPGEKRTGCEANHSPPPVVQVKDGVELHLTPPCLYGVHRNFTLNVCRSYGVICRKIGVCISTSKRSV